MQIPVRFRLILLACLLVLAAVWPALAHAQRSVPVDRVVAVVNDEVVTALELRERVEQIGRQLGRQGIEPPPREVLEQQVLERLILERAQTQLARETGLVVDEGMVDRAVMRIAENNNLNEAQLRSALEADGISWRRFREEIRTEIVLTRLREREVESGIVVTEAEIDSFLANNPDAFSGVEVLLAHILLRVPENASEAEVRQVLALADDLRARHAAGEDFARLAAAHSDAPDAVEGGLLGWRGKEQLPALFADAIRDLQPGQVSGVLRSGAGLHIVMFVAARGSDAGGPMQMEQTNARHILIRTSEVLQDSEAEARLLALRERIVYGESFEDLAKVHSDDLSGARGGDLGWIYPGDTVPEFERAMDALEPGEISQPVRSPFGWHLIQVVERRVQDVSGERIRSAARNVLRERKLEDAYENWLRELRDSTYVEYRLELD